MLELIEKFGLSRTLKSIFPNLHGIDFENVLFDQVLNQTNPLDYLSRNIDDNWYFGIGNMAMIFKTFKTKTTRTKTLNTLLKNNDLKKTDGYKNKANPNLTFWKGNGFKIEVVNIESANVILITNEEIFLIGFSLGIVGGFTAILHVLIYEFCFALYRLRADK